MTAFLLCMLTLFGLVVGSFLNVVIHRVPRGESLNTPPSHCPACRRPIRDRHNVPVLGWLVLRGRCADCAAPISIRYPLVEGGTGLLFLAVGVVFPPGDLPALLYFVAVGVALALIDVDTGRLPNAIVLPSYPVVAVLLAVAAGVRHDWWALGRAGLGGLAMGGFFLLLAVAVRHGMGLGDVKLAALVGLVLGYLSWGAVVVGALAAFVIGALAGVALVAGRRADRKTAVSFGPFLVAGALIAMFAGTPIAESYLRLVGQ